MLHSDNRWSERQVGITLDFGLIHFAFYFVDQRSEIRDQRSESEIQGYTQTSPGGSIGFNR
jgi:hypothetical protein